MKTIINLGIILGAVIAAIQIWTWVTESRKSLIADVEYAKLSLPPTLSVEFDRLHHLVGEDSLNEKLQSDFFRFEFNRLDQLLNADTQEELTQLRALLNEEEIRLKKSVQSLIEVLSSELQYEIRDTTPHEISSLDGTYWISVKNDGNKAVSEVRLIVPNTEIATISRAGIDEYLQPTGDLIKLGNIQPQESIDVIIWTTIRPSRFHTSSIQLTHETGLGKVLVRANARPFAQWIDRNSSLLLLYLFLAIFWAFWVFFIPYKFNAPPSNAAKNASSASKALDEESADV